MLNFPLMTLSPFYLCGTTAAGKTALALALAEAWGGEVVNADAFQVYRGLEILSAAPSEAEMASHPHHLFCFQEASEAMDAAKYEALARPVIAEIQARGKRPIVVGGSGLYLKFLTHGVAKAPSGDPELRAELESLSTEEIYRQLRELDPEEAAKQNAGNHRHLSRALEICLMTGGKASDLRSNFADASRVENLEGVVLQWPRECLAERIAQRTDRMLAEGAIKEVQNLPADAGTIRQAIGVREVEAHLRGELTHGECLEKITIATRQYAKRQRNWFRRESWLRGVEGELPLADHVAKVRSWVG